MPKSTHRRWWIAAGVLLLLLGLVVGLGLWRRFQGHAELEALLARSPEDEALLSTLPDLSPGLRARIDVVLGRGIRVPQVQDGSDFVWALRGDDPPEDLRKDHERQRADVQPFLALLEEEGICLSQAAFARPPDSPVPTYVDARVRTLVPSRRVADWLALDTLLADDPLPSLDRLDRVTAALLPTGGLIDSLIWGAVARRRDEAHLRLLYLEVLPKGRREAWIAESARHREYVTAGLRTERLLYTGPLTRDIAAGTSTARRALFPGDMDLEDWYEWYVLQPGEAMDGLRGERQIEQVLAGEDPRTGLSTYDRRYEDHPWVANVDALVWTVLQHESRHRMLRLAARLLAIEGLAPADEAALRTRHPDLAPLLDPGPWHLALDYERLAPHRVRLFFSPTTPLPAELASYRADLPTAHSSGPPDETEEPSPLRIRVDEIEFDLRR